MKLIHKLKKNLFVSWKGTAQFVLVLLPLVLGGWISCGKPNANGPVGPSLGMNLAVNLQAASNRAKATLLGAATNEVYYCVTGAAMSPVTGVAGPFSTSGSSGTVTLSILIPEGPARLMAFQINDASNHNPLAIGALQTDISAAGSNPTVEMGSLVRNCYSQSGASFQEGCYFAFQNESIADASVNSGTGFDIWFIPNGATYQLDAINGDSLVYMGNNNLVDDAVAPSTGYVTDSTTAKQAAGAAITDPVAGDVFCINLGSGNGLAWLYITSMGPGPGIGSPSFEFRLNTTLNYYGYQQTTGDLAGPCATPIPTLTPIPTPTPCPLC